MAIDFSSWGTHHRKVAKKYLQDKNLQKLPSNVLKWMDAARPTVEGKRRNFLTAPFWIPIYQDSSDYIMIMGGRQIFKSTACTDFLASAATSQSGNQICYVTHNHTSLSAFSKQKLQIGTFRTNPVLLRYLRHPGNVGEVSLKNNSTIYMLTDNDQYIHLEGKSPTLCILDEAQYQDLDHFGRVHQTMMATKGKIKIFGIGGEGGGAYERLWNETNQKEWKYEDQYWRERLEFDENGLVVGKYLRDVLKGEWVAQNPDAEYFVGYHIPQTIFAAIPLTEQDAIEKYKIHPRFSIEYQRNTLTDSEFRSHVMGTFYNSLFRPITKSMIRKVTVPYMDLSMLGSEEVRELKNTFGEEITVSMGVDFGSGKSSSTVVAIIIEWKKSKRIQLALIHKRKPENQITQALFIAKVFDAYGCDVGVGDLGYGANQVKTIQDGGFTINGRRCSGVGDQFFGCRTVSDQGKPFQMLDNVTDEHGDQISRVHIDKTYSIDNLIGIINATISRDGIKASKLIIPSHNDFHISFLLKDLQSITRKDLQDIGRITETRQRIKKEYNHPPDSVMALIYALTGLRIEQETEWHWISA